MSIVDSPFNIVIYSLSVVIYMLQISVQFEQCDPHNKCRTVYVWLDIDIILFLHVTPRITYAIVFI